MSLIIPANTLSSGGFAVDNSCRFNDGDTAYLHKTLGSGNRQIWTYSVWLKRSTLGTNQNWFPIQADAANNNNMAGYFDTADKFNIFDYNSGVSAQLITNRVFRDTSAWMHILVSADTTSGTANNRLRLYINGTEERGVGGYATDTMPSQNYNFDINENGEELYIGVNYISSASTPFDGYMSEVTFIDGQQLDATSFGEFDEDSGIWKPIDVSGLTFGTNGFYLDFEDSANLGNDANGGTDFTEVNLAATDQSTDTCTNNGAVLNNLYSGSGTGFSEGNLNYTQSASAWRSALSTIAPNKGKWYMESKHISGTYGWYGICDVTQAESFSNKWLGATETNGTGVALAKADGDVYINNSTAFNGSALSNGDIVGIALDLDNNYVYFSVNGTFLNSGNPASGSSGTGGFALPNKVALANYVFGVSSYAGSVLSTNFGSPSYSESGGNSDGNGYGNFKTAPTSGYYSLNSKNLSEFG